MDFEKLIGRYGLYLTTYVVGVVSGLVPVVNLEVFLVWIAALTPSSQGLAITGLATAGQMTAKTLMYLASAGILKISVRNPGKKLQAVQMKMARWQHRLGLFMFSSAFLGVPPFYVVSIASGICRVPFAVFVIWGFAGRFLRFAITVFFPHLLKGLFG
ncbi:MAG: putative rane protein [Candidatus Aminicenantes bacterium]|nr:putative rane protein [Candidatus Aminicenantes bacterium]